MIELGKSLEKGLGIMDKAYDNADLLESNIASDIASPALKIIFRGDYAGFFSDLVSVLRAIGIVATIALAIGFLVLVYKINQHRELKKIPEPSKAPEPASGGMLMGKWREIMEHLESDRETEWKLAVIEADKLVYELLEKSGFPGETMGEKLTNMRHEQMRTLPYLWKAHLLRNRVVHETDLDITYKEIREALGYFAATLEELGVL